MHEHLRDTEIHDVFQRDVQLPPEIAAQFEALPQTIADMPVQNRNKPARRRSIRAFVSIAAVVCVILLSATAVYFHDALFVKYAALDVAQQNGYMQEVASDVIVNPGIKTSVQSVMMDAHNAVIVFEYELDEPIPDLMNNCARFENLVITNEDGKIIEASHDPFVLESLSTTGGDTFETEDNKTIRHALILTGDYPKSEQLHITFDGIGFLGSMPPIWGTWDFTVQVQDAAQQVIRYTSDDNYDDVKISSVELYPMSMLVTVEFQREIHKHTPFLVSLTDEEGTKYKWSRSDSEIIVRDGQTITSVVFEIEVSAFEAKESYVLELEGLEGERNNNYQFVLQKADVSE